MLFSGHCRSGVELCLIEFCGHLYVAYYGGIEAWQVLRGNPIFLVLASAYVVNFIGSQKVRTDLKFCYVSAASGCIPVPCNFDCIVLGQNGIEYWLLRQPRRKYAHGD